MSQPSTGSVFAGRRSTIPWAIVPPLLVVLLALGIWWRNQSDTVGSGQRQLAAGQYQQAVDTLTAAIANNENDARAYADRGSAYAGLQRYDEAIADFSKALNLSPSPEDTPTLYNNRGLAYLNLAQRDQALTDFNKAIELKPDYAIAFANRATLHQNSNAFTEAINDFNKAIELDNRFAAAYVGRGQVYVQTGEVDQAINDFSKAIELDGKNVAAYSGRADLYLATGERDKAIADFRVVIENATDNARDELLKLKAEQQLKVLGAN